MSLNSGNLSCPICFNEEDGDTSFITLACNCTACVGCVSQWITLKITENQYTIDSRTTCIMADCKKETPLQEIYKRLLLSDQQKMDEALLQVYFSRQQDIRRCPNSNCKYAGIINMKISCTSPLQCNLCGSTWRDKQHYTKFEKILNYLKNRSKAKAEDLSQAWIKQRSKKSPSCKVNIEKNGGCDHMTCKHCNYEFCWICFRIHPLHYQVLHSYHQNFLPLMAILLILSIFILILYSFGFMQTFKFFMSGLAWLISNSYNLVAKLVYNSIILLVWLIVQTFSFLGWLYGWAIPLLIQFIASSYIFIAQFIYSSAHLLVQLIHHSIACISWLIECSIPHLVGFISSGFTFIMQLIYSSINLLMWLFYKGIACFGRLIDSSTPFLVEFISSSLTFLVWLISSTITFLAWFINSSITFIIWLIDSSAPFLIWFTSSTCTVIAQIFYNSANLLVWLLSKSLACFGWLIDCSVPFLVKCFSSSLTFLIWLISSIIAFLVWFINCSTTFFGWLADCSIPLFIEFFSCILSLLIRFIYFIITSLGWLFNGITTCFTSSIFYIAQFSSPQVDPANLQTSEEFL